MDKILKILDSKKYLIEGFLFLLIFLIQITMFFYLNKKEVLPEKKETIKEEVVLEEPKKYYVDIKGEVKKPGIYEVDETKRVMDVITLAGGLTKNANTKANNLSQKVIDEMVIIIYSKDEIEDFSTIKQEEKQINENCNKKQTNLNNDSCLKDIKETTSNIININKATKEELMTISGIGESKAITIITYREENGLFTSVEDIQNVSGIGEALYAKIKDYITT